MKQKKAVKDCYNAVANEYGNSFYNELDYKSLDQLLLSRFALDNKHKGLMLDLACGPGHTTQFLKNKEVDRLIGIDLSEQLIDYANKRNEHLISFQTGDMLNLRFDDDSVGSAICLYGIVHFLEEELILALKEIYRVLSANGQFLFSFHVGDTSTTLKEFLGQSVAPITFYYFEIERVLVIAENIGFKRIEALVRYPYPEEYPSQRAYILLKKGEQPE